MNLKTGWGEAVFAFLDDPLEGDLHGKRVLWLANATLGVMVSASLAVAVIGQSLAQARFPDVIQRSSAIQRLVAVS